MLSNSGQVDEGAGDIDSGTLALGEFSWGPRPSFNSQLYEFIGNPGIYGYGAIRTYG